MIDSATNYEILGAISQPDRVIQVRLADPIAVAKKQGAIASLATSLLPETITQKVYEEAVKKFQDALRAEGVQADVRIVDAVTLQPVGPSSGDRRGTDWKSFGLGAGAAAGIWVVWKIVAALLGGGR